MNFFVSIAATLSLWNVKMGNHFWLFALLAVCTNTVAPMPFETVLLFYVAKYPDSTFLLIATGSVCAAAGGLIDLALASILRKRLLKRFDRRIMKARFPFYLIVFLFALLPVPFCVVRASLLNIQAHPAVYGVAISSGRLLRYVIFTATILTSGVSCGIIFAALMFASAWIAKRYWFSNRRILSGALP